MPPQHVQPHSTATPPATSSSTCVEGHAGTPVQPGRAAREVPALDQAIRRSGYDARLSAAAEPGEREESRLGRCLTAQARRGGNDGSGDRGHLKTIPLAVSIRVQVE